VAHGDPGPVSCLRNGGSGGGNNNGPPGDGSSGNATATSTATSQNADVTSSAYGYGLVSHVSQHTLGHGPWAPASAARSSSNPHAGPGFTGIPGSLVTAATAFADAPVAGARAALTSAAICNRKIHRPLLSFVDSIVTVRSGCDAVDGSSTGTRVPSMWVTIIGLDIAKSVFQVHGVDADGNAVLRRQLKRRYVLAFFPEAASLPGWD
jgi:hypothetical protein